MKLQENTKRYAEFTTGDVVYFNGLRMTVYRPSWYELERADIRVAVLNRASGKVSHIHFEDLEVEAEEVPEPPAKKYEETLYYQETSTGALFKRQRADNQLNDYFICVGAMKPSVTVLPGDIPVGFKRLYKEA